jgi:hypothetical protein
LNQSRIENAQEIFKKAKLRATVSKLAVSVSVALHHNGKQNGPEMGFRFEEETARSCRNPSLFIALRLRHDWYLAIKSHLRQLQAFILPLFATFCAFIALIILELLHP